MNKTVEDNFHVPKTKVKKTKHSLQFNLNFVTVLTTKDRLIRLSLCLF